MTPDLRSLPLLSGLLLLGAALAGSAPAQSSPYFRALGPNLVVEDLSADGEVAVGTDKTSAETRPFRWTPLGGREDLPLPASTLWGVAGAISADGSTIAGSRDSTVGLVWDSTGRQEFRLPRARRLTVADVTRDGGTVVGTMSFQILQAPTTYLAFRRTRAGTVSYLDWPGRLPLEVSAISADGAVVVANAAPGTDPLAEKAHRWDAAGTRSTLPTPDASSAAADLSADGSVVVGRSGDDAVCWQGNALVRLGDLPGGAVRAAATAVSSDGAIVVGNGTAAAGPRAFVWDRVNGMRQLDEVLRARGLRDELQGWAITSVSALATTRSGAMVVSGLATKDGVSQAFVASASLAAFVPLGTLGASSFASVANALSADGSTVVGVDESSAGGRAFVWSAATGMVPVGPGARNALAVSGDGAVVAGYGENDGGFRAVRSGAFFNFGRTSRANAVSADGRAVAGSFGSGDAAAAYRWTATTTERYPTWIPSHLTAGQAFGLSGDGSIFVGASLPHVFGGANVSARAMLWRSNGSQIPLGDLPGGRVESEALAISGDGTVVVGWSHSANGPEAFRWTAAGGMVGLGDLPGPGFASRALAVSPDGSVVAGVGVTNGQNRAFLWQASTGMVELQGLLAARGLGPALAGWRLVSASGVTVDAGGTVVVSGTGVDPGGRLQAFLVGLPPALAAGAPPVLP